MVATRPGLQPLRFARSRRIEAHTRVPGGWAWPPVCVCSSPRWLVQGGHHVWGACPVIGEGVHRWPWAVIDGAQLILERSPV